MSSDRHINCGCSKILNHGLNHGLFLMAKKWPEMVVKLSFMSKIRSGSEFTWDV